MAENLYQALLRMREDDTGVSNYLHTVLQVDGEFRSPRVRTQYTKSIEMIYNSLSLIVNNVNVEIPQRRLRGIDILNRATLSMLVDFEAGANSLTISPRLTHRTNTIVWLYVAAVLRGHSAHILAKYEINMEQRICDAVESLPQELQKIYNSRRSDIISTKQKQILFCSDFEFIDPELVERYIINGHYDQYILESTVNRNDNTNYYALCDILESKNFLIRTFSPAGVGMTDYEIEDMKKSLNHDEETIRAEIFCSRKNLEFTQV